MHKYHNQHDILHKLYVWFGKKRTQATEREQKFLWLGEASTAPL